MNKKQRRARAADLLVKLESLRDEWEKEASAEQIGPQDKEKSRRERLKTIEAEIAVVRLMQSEGSINNPADSWCAQFFGRRSNDLAV